MDGSWSRTALYLAALLCALHCRLGSSQCMDSFNISANFEVITLEGGVRTCFRCLFNGAVNPTTTWTRNAVQIMPPVGTVTDGVLTIFDPTMLMLGIQPNIQLTCIAAPQQYTVFLRQRDLQPPTINSPNVTTVDEGDNLTLTCNHLNSFPVTQFYWRTPNGSIISGTVNLALMLQFTNILRSSSGNYTCTVQDDRSSTASSTVTIVVQYAPDVTTTVPSPHLVPRGTTLTLSCDYDSVPPPTITWLHNGSPLSPTDPRVTITSSDSRSDLMRTNLGENEGGTYTCNASNVVGSDSVDITVVVQVPPDAPTNVMVGSPGTNMLGVSWTNGDNGNSPITGVTIAFSATGHSGSQNFSGGASLQSATLMNLMPFRMYTISVFVVNAVGRSEPGNGTGTTLSLRLGAPTQVRVVALTSRIIRLDWQPPAVDSDTTDAIRSWEIQYEIVGNAGSRMTQPVNDAAARSFNLTMLGRGTPYRVRLAGMNVRGLGDFSPYMEAMTPVDPPTMPQGLAVANDGAYTLRVTWDAPTDDGGRAIVNYRLEIREVEGSGSFVELDRVTGVSQTISNSSQFIISENTTYQVRVTAFNGVEFGESSTAMGATPPIGPPLPLLTAPMTTNITSTSVDVSWQSPGGYVDFYNIQYKLSSVEWTSPNDVRDINVMGFRTSVSINGLRPNTTYDLRIRTRNANGLSEWSPEATFMTRPTPPTVTIEGPSTITAGQTVVLVCNVSRDAMVTWSRNDGLPLPNTPDGNVLRIETPEAEDSGVYQCSAEGVVAMFNLVVMEPPPTDTTQPPFPTVSTPRTVVIIAASVVGGVALLIFLVILVIAVVCVCRWKKRGRNIYSVKSKRVNWIETSTSYEERPPPRVSARTGEGTPSFDIPEDYTTHSSFNTLEKQNRIQHTASSEENLVGRDINYAQLDLEPRAYHPERGQDVQYSNLTSSPTSFQYIPQDPTPGKGIDWPDSAPHYSNTVV